MKKDFTDKVAEWIYRKLFEREQGKSLLSEKVKKIIFHLYPGTCEKEIKRYYIEKIKLMLMIGSIGGVWSAFLLISSYTQSPIVDNGILRNNYQQGVREIPLTVEWEDETSNVLLTIDERHYTKSQLDDLLKEVLPKLETAVLGENESLNRVTKDLNFVSSVESYPFSITWECQEYRYIDSEGALRRDNLSNEAVPTTIKAILTYDDYYAEHLFSICIYPEQLSSQEQFQKEITTLLETAEEKTKYDDTFILPDEMDGKSLFWTAEKNYNWLILLALTIVVTILLYFFKDQDLEKRLQERENQMLMDYSEMVSKLAVYMGAGMSVRYAWEKIVTDYEKSRLQEKQKRYVYEEMWITCQEMKSGISEVAAYDRFGKRCNVQIYLKFSTLLIQNLRKGSTGLSALLREESRLAFSERKNYARKKGEEAGTKLLLPMMLMLCLVMVMIMLPAFMTF